MARTETFHNMGFRLTYPDMFDHTIGQVSPMAFGDTGDGVYLMMFSYMAVSAEDIKAIAGKSESGELSEEDKLKIADAMGSILVVVGMKGEQSPEEIAKALKRKILTAIA